MKQSKLCVLLASIFSAFGSSAAEAENANTFIREAIAAESKQTAIHQATWHLGDETRWSVDQDKGILTLYFLDGTIATAPLQIVGTLNKADGTFLWAWDHPAIKENLRDHAKLARDFGQKYQLTEYTNRKIQCDPEKAVEFMAVASRLGKANGVFRGDSGPGSPIVFMTFGEVTLEKPTAVNNGNKPKASRE